MQYLQMLSPSNMASQPGEKLLMSSEMVIPALLCFAAPCIIQAITNHNHLDGLFPKDFMKLFVPYN